MARKPAASVEAEPGPMLALIETPDIPAPTPVDQARIVLLDGEKFDRFYDRMKSETDAHTPDTTTITGRAAIKALAFRVTKTHTTLKAASLELTEGWRKQTAAVNAARGPMIERLVNLAAEVRQPLTAWEAAEDARVAANAAVIAEIRDAATILPDDTAITVEQRGRRIHDIRFPPETWTDAEIAEAAAAKVVTVKVLVAARDRLRQEEADRAELARLRAAEAERLEREEAARLAAEALEQAKREEAERAERVIAAERARIAAEQRREQEIADAAAAAERRAREAADREREAERQREQAEHERQLAAERAERARLEREASEREAQAQREREAAAAIERRAEAHRRAEAETERKRQANRAHRSAVQTEIKVALMSCGLDEEQAKKVVLALVAGNVPHVEVKF